MSIMRRPLDRAGLLAGALGLVLAFPADAWAYIDPGTGSYLFQLTAAGFLAAVYTFRRYWDVLRARLGSRGRTRRPGGGSADAGA